LEINYNRDKNYYTKVNFPRVITNLRVLRTFLRKISPKLVIVVNEIPGGLFFVIIGTTAKILKENNTTKFFQSKENPSLYSKLKSYIRSKFDFQVVLSEEQKSFYDSDQIYHIPNPIPFSILREPKLNGREKAAMAAGRISPVKRFDILLNIWAEFKILDSTWKLEIYGDGLKTDINAIKDQI